MQPVKIIILGVQCPTAQAIMEQLAIHGYPSEQVFLLDQHTKVLKKQFYKGEEKRITSLKVFDWKQPCIIVLCDKKMLRFCPRKKLHKHTWLIDCTGYLSEAPCIVPAFNENKISSVKNHILCAPTSMSVILSHVISDLIPYQLIKVESVALIGTSFLDEEASKMLREQTRSVYTQIPVESTSDYPPLAFNLIPQIQVPQPLTCPCQIQNILDLSIDFHYCFVPVFRGFCLFVSCQLKHKIPHLDLLWQNNPFIHVMGTKEKGFILSCAATLSETKVFIMDINYHENALNFWVVGDDIQTGMTLNTIHIIDSLIKK